MALKAAWRSGPISSIECTPQHQQPVFSLAVGKNAFVTGSADHSLREYSLYLCDHPASQGNSLENSITKNTGTKSGLVLVATPHQAKSSVEQWIQLFVFGIVKQLNAIIFSVISKIF